MNEYLNNLLQTEEQDYVVAGDTDSIYIKVGDLVRKVFGSGVDTVKVVNFLDKVASQKLEPFIDQSYAILAENMNAYAQKMQMKREAIADKGIWTAKKRYVLNVYDNEGVRYAEPKLKVMGLEMVKSSTPAICRTALKKALTIIMNEDEYAVQQYIEKFREEFKSHPFEDVAFPRSISDLNKYTIGGKELEIPKGTPIHVRGGLLYNHLLKQHNLEKRYEQIKDGEKIKFCYLQTPNPARQNVLSVLSTLPKEFGLNEYIDYDTQFEKSFLEPLRIILNSVGWSPEKQSTLEEFFS